MQVESTRTISIRLTIEEANDLFNACTMINEDPNHSPEEANRLAIISVLYQKLLGVIG